MSKTFLKYDKPLITAMIQCSTAEECIAKIKASAANGADAFGVQLCKLKREQRTKKNLTEIFSACGDKPIYVTSYRHAESTGYSDDDCAELLLSALECGATLCDVMGDLFDRSPHYELTTDEKAVKKQKELIEEIHRRGGEVLMSSHTFKSLSVEENLMIAKAHAERGADIIKLSTFASAKKVYLKLFINESSVKNGGSGRVTLCGLEDGFECGGELYNCKTGWAESDITGNSAADLKLFSYNNYMAQCTVTGEEAPQTELCFDVTEYVKAQADGVYAFMVHAAADNASAPVFMSFYSSEASSAEVRPQLSAVGIDIMRTSVVQSNRSYAASGAVHEENISASAALVVLCRDENGAVTDITVNKSSAARGGITLFACSGEAPPQTAHIKAMLVDLKTMKPFAGSREE